MSTTRPKRLATLFLSILITASGCTYRKPVAKQAVNYNRAVEQAHNQTVFLNIVRSMKRLPQHYTAISRTAALPPLEREERLAPLRSSSRPLRRR